jgi:hypothetical protein
MQRRVEINLRESSSWGCIRGEFIGAAQNCIVRQQRSVRD